MHFVNQHNYSQPSCLFFGPHIVSSEEGAQPGDPIGPLLLCNPIHLLLSSMKSNLNLGYLDDVTLGGTVKTAAPTDVAEIIRTGAEISLSLNELIAHEDFQVDDA